MRSEIPSLATNLVVGLDLGKAQDFTAVAILERCRDELHLRHLERAQLGTAYPDIVESVVKLMDRPELLDRSDLVVDATGVGVAVVDSPRQAGLNLVPVTITAGKHTKRVKGTWRVPKQLLVAELVAALERGRLKVATACRAPGHFSGNCRLIA